MMTWHEGGLPLRLRETWRLSVGRARGEESLIVRLAADPGVGCMPARVDGLAAFSLSYLLALDRCTLPPDCRLSDREIFCVVVAGSQVR